jgi:TonB family protein
MYFDFEDHKPDVPTLPRSLSRLEVILLTIVTYLAMVIVALVWPTLPMVKEAEAARLQEVEQQRLEALKQQRENARFVFVQPRVDIKAERAPDVAELSDIDRRARTVERAPNPTNRLPFSRGNTTERIEAPAPVDPRRNASPQAETTPPAPEAGGEPAREGMPLPTSPTAVEPRSADKAATQRGPSPGVLADAIRNVQKYVEKEGFANLQGGQSQDIAPSIQFDTKGVEFGPWLRRFIAQIRRNWFIPYAAMSLRGHVVVTFYVHKDGRISELKVLKPSTVDAFTNSAYNAMASSNPTTALPPEYPDDRAFFTVTFYFNETQ